MNFPQIAVTATPPQAPPEAPVIVVDERFQPLYVAIPWTDFCRSLLRNGVAHANGRATPALASPADEGADEKEAKTAALEDPPPEPEADPPRSYVVFEPASGVALASSFEPEPEPEQCEDAPASSPVSDAQATRRERAQFLIDLWRESPDAQHPEISAKYAERYGAPPHRPMLFQTREAARIADRAAAFKGHGQAATSASGPATPLPVVAAETRGHGKKLTDEQRGYLRELWLAPGAGVRAAGNAFAQRYGERPSDITIAKYRPVNKTAAAPAVVALPRKEAPKGDRPKLQTAHWAYLETICRAHRQADDATIAELFEKKFQFRPAATAITLVRDRAPRPKAEAPSPESGPETGPFIAVLSMEARDTPPAFNPEAGRLPQDPTLAEIAAATAAFRATNLRNKRLFGGRNAFREGAPRRGRVILERR